MKVLEHNPGIDSSQIWNCDESGFPTNPSKGCVIAKKVIENNFTFFLVRTQILQNDSSVCKKGDISLSSVGIESVSKMV